MLRVSIIIPTYNEAKNLPFLVEEIFNIVNKTEIDAELIIVDDNSPDGTGQVADELSQKFPIKVVHRSGKLGLGSAVREGFSRSDRPLLGVMDADLSHDPKNINEMIGLLKENDIVLGSRFEDGSTVEQWKWWRKIISEAGVAATRFLTGVKDPLSGFFFLKREVIDGVQLNTVGYKILLEILIKGKHLRVKEVPFQFRIRKFSTSKLDKKEYWLFLKQVIFYSFYKIWLWARSNKYLVGILILAAALLAYRVSYRTFWGDETAVLAYLKESLGGFLVSYFKYPDNHPPLYYFLVLLASKIFPWSELTIRLVSILAGLGIVGLVYKFTHRVSNNKKIALLASFFTALSSYFVLISQMARYHSLAAFFSLLTFYFFYRLLFEKNDKRIWYWYLIAMVLTGYSDYPHFFYVAFITNAIYLYGLIRRRLVMPFVKWFLGQLAAAIFLSPLVWMIYHRIVIQGDGGWSNVNLLANSWKHIVLAVLFHIYSFFFGENIFPWNYFFFGIGAVVLGAMVASLIYALRKKMWTAGQLFIVWLSIASIIINTIFMNFADPRYNFIVYPKFGFVAYPLAVMMFVLCLSKLPNHKIRATLFLLWGAVALFGLYNFYQAKNYLNPSYFRTFNQYEYIRDHSRPDQYLAITPNAIQGVYDFYKEKYFNNTISIPFDHPDSAGLPPHAQVWFFGTGSEAPDESVDPGSVIPAGYKILDHYDSVPLDPTFKKVKERILNRPSYNYKYSVFLLEKI